MTIVSNSSVGASKQVIEYDQVTSGTRESSVHPPTQPSNPDDAEDEGAAKVCLKSLKVFSYLYVLLGFWYDGSIITYPITVPSPIPLTTPE